MDMCQNGTSVCFARGTHGIMAMAMTCEGFHTFSSQRYIDLKLQTCVHLLEWDVSLNSVGLTSKYAHLGLHVFKVLTYTNMHYFKIIVMLWGK